jgi:hypothetical protein
MTAIAPQPKPRQGPSQIDAARTLNVFRARITKRRLIEKYCRGEISMQALDQVFKVFEELRSA